MKVRLTGPRRLPATDASKKSFKDDFGYPWNISYTVVMFALCSDSVFSESSRSTTVCVVLKILCAPKLLIYRSTAEELEKIVIQFSSKRSSKIDVVGTHMENRLLSGEMKARLPDLEAVPLAITCSYRFAELFQRLFWISMEQLLHRGDVCALFKQCTFGTDSDGSLFFS